MADDAPSLSWMAYSPQQYEDELQGKAEATRTRMSPHLAQDAAPLAIYSSPPSGFRQRARFAMARFPPSNALSYALFDKGVLLAAPPVFPIAAEPVNVLMPRLLDALNASAKLGASLAAVHFLSTRAGDMLVTLIYSAPVLDDDWRSEALALRQPLGLSSIVGRAKGQHVVVDRDWVEEEYVLSDGRRLRYRQVEGSFSNPSALMCEHTLAFLCGAASEAAARCAAAGGQPPALLELYCGNGNHTVALGRHFARVLAVEIDRRLCDAAELNLAANGVTNASIICATSGKFCDRLLRRLRRRRQRDAAGGTCASEGAKGASAKEPGRATSGDADGDWLSDAAERTDVILVDPPRCGLDSVTLELVSHFDHILFISCNPPALQGNLDDALGSTHEIRRWAIFDHFPYTPHLEAGVYLSRRAVST